MTATSKSCNCLITLEEKLSSGTPVVSEDEKLLKVLRLPLAAMLPEILKLQDEVLGKRLCHALEQCISVLEPVAYKNPELAPQAMNALANCCDQAFETLVDHPDAHFPVKDMVRLINSEQAPVHQTSGIKITRLKDMAKQQDLELSEENAQMMVYLATGCEYECPLPDAQPPSVSFIITKPDF